MGAQASSESGCMIGPVGTSSIGPHGTSGNGKGKGGKGDGKGSKGGKGDGKGSKGGKCDDWMRTLIADSIDHVMKVAWLAYSKGHDDGVADEREGLTEGKEGSFFGPPAEGSFFWTPAPGESSSPGCPKRRHANAEGDESGTKAPGRSDWGRDGDGERDVENDGGRLSDYSLDSETLEGLRSWD